MMSKLSLFVVLFIIFLAGCGNLNSAYRDFDVNSGIGAMVDIKQRAVMVAQKTDTKGPAKVIVCAEPSPDALSAYALELAAKANVREQVSAELSAASRESAAYVGLRTQTIQLLRDGFYRLCEAYMSGALDEDEYGWMMRRYQRNMVALLAIEQLTGAIRAPAVTLNLQGSAEILRFISEMKSRIEDIDAKIAAKEEETKKAEKDEQKAKLGEEIKKLKGEREKISKDLENARALLATSPATPIANPSGLPIQRSDAQIQSVSEVVEQMAEKILEADDMGMLCFKYLRDNPKSYGPLKEKCEKHFDTTHAQHEASIKLKLSSELGAIKGRLKAIEDQLKEIEKSQ